MRRIPLTLLICTSFSLLGSATCDNYANKDRPRYAAGQIIDFIRESVLLRSAARTALLPLAAAAFLMQRPAWLLSVVVLTTSALLVSRRIRKEEI